VQSRKPPALLAASPLATCHVAVADTLLVLSSLRSSLRILEQKRDCWQSIEDIKIDNVYLLSWSLGASRRMILLMGRSRTAVVSA